MFFKNHKLQFYSSAKKSLAAPRAPAAVAPTYRKSSESLSVARIPLKYVNFPPQKNWLVHTNTQASRFVFLSVVFTPLHLDEKNFSVFLIIPFREMGCLVSYHFSAIARKYALVAQIQKKPTDRHEKGRNPFAHYQFSNI